MQLSNQKNALANLFCIATLISAFAFYSSQPLVSDVSYFVESAKRILQGAAPYTDILENNPPLAFWITLPPVFFAKLLGVNAATAFVIYLLLINAGILMLVFHLTKNHVLVCAIAAVTSYSLAFGFGQREYFALLFLVPFVACGKIEYQLTRIVVGILLGLAICFKPHFAVIPICVEAYRMRGIWRQELFVAGIVAALYPALIWLIYPKYYTEIVPLVLLTYGAYDASLIDIFMSSTVIFFGCIAIFTFAISQFGQRQNHPSYVWLAAAFGGFIAHLLQHKGWPYQLLPGFGFASVAYLLAVASLRNPLLRLFLIFPFVLSVVVGLKDFTATQNYNITKFDKLLEGHQPKSMMMLSYDIGDSFPYLPHHNIQWVGHFQSLWMMAIVAKQELPLQTAKAITESTTALLSKDLSEQQPDYVIVDQRAFASGGNNVSDNPLQNFESYANFASAWQQYKLVNTNSGFELWKRKF